MRAAILFFILIWSLLIFAWQSAFGASVISDSADISATHCAWYLDTQSREVLPVGTNAGGVFCSRDVSDISNGQHTVQAAFVVQSAWGDEEGPKSVPFDFTRPSAPASPPSEIRLVP